MEAAPAMSKREDLLPLDGRMMRTARRVTVHA